jgi:chromosome segregation protein
MRLKQIKLAGFKSFVDPTTVSFPGNRCAVVGPNGCGKSNIIDAVRWVMGESSARQLRGESLTDVIFSGSATRKPTAQASVELLFDNSDGRIGNEYASFAEISIRRKVTRDAQSNYYLNGTKCRRRDIMDIFLGTGFGPRSYSIIEQGMISQLVEAKPEELRMYLEEAAGISKYKERRRETETRIRHTRENLDRLNDIREELERQLNHLKRQARAAERYRGLKDDERRATADLYAVQLIDLQRLLDDREKAIRDLEVELERAVAGQRAADAGIEKQRAEYAEQGNIFNGIQGRFYQLGADIARVEEAIAYNEQRVQQLELDLDAVTQRREETDRQLVMDATEIETLSANLAALDPRFEAARVKEQASAGDLEALEGRLRQSQAAWDDLADRRGANQREADVQGSRLEHVEQVLQRLRARLSQLDDEYEGSLGADVSGDIRELASEIESADGALREAETDVERCLNALGAARDTHGEREHSLEEGRLAVQTLRHELASLQAVQQAALGRDAGSPDDWLHLSGLADAPRIGEVMTVEPGWERAVETVLGDRLQAIGVTRLDTFLETLPELDRGVVTLVEGESADAPENANGDLAALAGYVKASLGLGSLLQGIYAADSLDAARSHRGRLGSGESIITREGIWLGRDWARVDRAEASADGIIQRGHELESLGARVEAAEAQQAEVQQSVRAARDQVEALDQERTDLHSRIADLGQSLGQLRADHGVHQVRMEEAGARRERVDKERVEISTQIDQESDRLKEARDRLVAAELQRERLSEERDAMTGHREQALTEVEAARVQTREDRDLFHALSAERQTIDSRLIATKTARERLVNQQLELDERRGQLAEGIAESRTPLPELKQDLESRLAERLAVEQQLGDARRDLEAAEHQVRELEGARGEHEGIVSGIRDRLESIRVEREGLAVRTDALTEQLRGTGFEYSAIKAELPDDAEEPSYAERLEKLTNRIHRLGPINLAAIDEYQSQSERKTYLDEQHGDLSEALETLQNAIRRIDRETRARFKETFEEVNSHLGKLFPKVFGGGSAYLELTGEDLLDTGVTLMARPPGKRNSSIHLLSGGEKALTAVALIFAIFQLNPSPVCLLDEVDAPLDDSNVVRFADLIHDMSEDVQFVIITHNKLTMEMADHLMGITMAEAGVSRLVSVDVEEAAAMAAV